MKFFIVDDSLAIRAMLSEIIYSEGLGTVEGEAEDGIEVSKELLRDKKIDILLIDLLMKERDGLETIRALAPEFKGKIIMISQVDQKDTVAEAYLLGIAHFITKPINKYEVVSVIQNETKHYLRAKSIANIQQSLISLTDFHHGTVVEQSIESNTITKPKQEVHSSGIIHNGNNILMELGIVGDSGYYDLLNIIEYLFELENQCDGKFQFPSLKQLFKQVAYEHCQSFNNSNCINKEAKASEQRVRRAIHQALNNLASIGLTDYGNPIFENYASKFFDFSQVRMKMLELDGKATCNVPSRLNIKKFIEVFYLEAKDSIIK
ncbi:response regulator [Bacillus sp. Bva_UNVM-123]|uniref:response regulator n=1 Tax=Bacillus sp. Bva_UNVM-123 TaxID=2829798 RepID=UPI00391F4D72